MTPRNYKTWYHYVSGKNDELKETIDSIIENKESFTEDTNEALYQRFFEEKPEKNLKEIQEKMHQTLLSILKETADMAGQTEQYESSVLKSTDKLSEDMTVQDIRNVLDEVLVATKKVVHSGKAIKQKLNNTTNILEGIKNQFVKAKDELLKDFLTGILNRKGFTEKLESLVTNTTNFCLLMLDIDHFKSFNDKHGHLVGDEVLKFVANNIQKTVRGGDVVARFGGEEFVVILPKTELLGAKAVAENIRTSFAKMKLQRKNQSEDLGNITVSIGGAQYLLCENLETLINRADEALYFAKNSGRNRVVTEMEMQPEHIKC
jgi:diguanylate cyclase